MDWFFKPPTNVREWIVYMAVGFTFFFIAASYFRLGTVIELLEEIRRKQNSD